MWAMWAQERIFGRVSDRRVWPPVCSALLAALLLDSDLALAAGGETTLPPALSADARVLDPESRLASEVLSPFHLEAPSPAPTPVMTAPLFASDLAAAPAVRLEARSVLGLREMFTFSGTWRTELPSERAMRTLELIDAHPTPAPPADDFRLDPDPIQNPEATWFDEHIELTFNDGVAYKKNFAWKGMNLRLKIWGPFLKGDPGLGVRMRGLQLYGHAVEVRARATTDLQDLRIQIAF